MPKRKARSVMLASRATKARDKRAEAVYHSDNNAPGPSGTVNHGLQEHNFEGFRGSDEEDSDSMPPLYLSGSEEQDDVVKVTNLSIRKRLIAENGSFDIPNAVRAEKDEKLVVSKELIIGMAHSILCETCHEPGLAKFFPKDIDQAVEVVCPACNDILFSYVPKRIGPKKIAETTASLVNDSMIRGGGYSGFLATSSAMNLGAITSERYQTYTKIIGPEIIQMYEEQDSIIRQCIVNDYATRGIIPDAQGILNIDVSFDGTWLTRGHSSHIGAGFVIEVYSGFVVDFEVLSNYCQKCDRIEKKRGSPEVYQKQKVTHEESGECLRNFNGKAGAMEKDSAIRMFQRSVERKRMRYTTFLSDGDSSAYTGVHTLDPYPGVEILKEECVNHVAKRLGTRLRNLKKVHTKDRVTVSGKVQKVSTLGGKNKLTDMVIDKLTRYFGKAIRDCVGKTSEVMRVTAISGYLHCGSSDARPRHAMCPTTANSWCFYNKAIANNQTPPSHSTMKVRFNLDEEERRLVFQIYKDLTAAPLMEKCLMGRTQNPNEAFHAKVWKKVQKIKFYGRQTVNYAAARTVVEHNIGYENACVLRRLDFPEPSIRTRQLQKKRDKERERLSIIRTRAKKSINIEACADYGPGAH